MVNHTRRLPGRSPSLFFQLSAPDVRMISATSRGHKVAKVSPGAANFRSRKRMPPSLTLIAPFGKINTLLYFAYPERGRQLGGGGGG